MKTVEKTIINIDDVRNEIIKNVGKQIKIQENNRQGKKVKEYAGEILSAYDSVFIVRIQIRYSFLNKSFSYIDFLTNEMAYRFLWLRYWQLLRFWYNISKEWLWKN